MNDPEGFIDPEGLRVGFYFNRAYWKEQNATTIENLCWLSLELEPETIKPLGDNTKEYFTADGWRYFLQLKEEHQQRCRDILGQLNVGGIGLAPLNGDDVSTGRSKQYEIKICEFCEWAIAQAWDKRPFGLGMLKRLDMQDSYVVTVELRHISLEYAVKLSLGISLESEIPKHLTKIFEHRLSVIQTRVETSELSLDKYEKISIRSFGAFAHKMKWWIPHDFPTDEEIHQEIFSNQQTDNVPQDHEQKKNKYDEWQNLVNETYAKNNMLSHSRICTLICRELGTSSENLRRRTKSPKSA